MNAPARDIGAEAEGVIKIAVMAVGGQGGGVLANWIADLADAGGYVAQMTSVAGVAQRTGATIYYIEMAPKTGRPPVFALSPAPGDIDILIASELMEAGRAVMRGFVTPDRTTLIASTHRILAISEKQVPGDGRGDAGEVERQVRDAALSAVCFDMEALAAAAGSFISASLFGGLAKSGALPFDRALFEDVIAASARGADKSLAAFRAAADFAPVEDAPDAARNATTAVAVDGPPDLRREWQALAQRVEASPALARETLAAGLAKTVDYQDLAYGAAYLDKVAQFAPLDADGALTAAAAKAIANAMCYDDILRVADLKTRSSRDRRLRAEQEAGDGIVRVTEFFHPRGAEICSLLPAGLGAWIESRPWATGALDKLVNRGRRVRSDRIVGFTMLWLIAALRPWRRGMLRHRVASAHLSRLVDNALAAAPKDPALAVEILGCQRLIKGYSDTHARGLSKFDRVMTAAALVSGRDDAAEWVRRLREAALQDEEGEALDGAILTIRSFTEEAA